MKKPTFEDMAAAMLCNHADYITHAQQTNYMSHDGTISSWVSVGINMAGTHGMGTIHTKVFLWDDYAQISTENIDKRRKKRFLYADYARVEVLAIDVIDYMLSAHKKDYSMNGWSRSLQKKWGKSFFHDKWDEHAYGKIIDTF